jgi:hypothetical protein
MSGSRPMESRRAIRIMTGNGHENERDPLAVRFFLTPAFLSRAFLIRWRSPACPRVFSFVRTLPVSGRGGRALNLGNKAAEDP